MALPTSPGPQQRSSARMAWLRGKGIANAISSRSLGFDAPCSAHRNSSNSSMWLLIRASISALLMGGAIGGAIENSSVVGGGQLDGHGVNYGPAVVAQIGMRVLQPSFPLGAKPIEALLTGFQATSHKVAVGILEVAGIATPKTSSALA